MILETRILEVFTRSGLSKTEFAARLGVSNAVLSHISSGRNKAGTELILGVLSSFPDISPDWLLFGQGPMQRSDGEKTPEKVRKELNEHLRGLKTAQQAVQNRLEQLESMLLGLK